MASVIKKRKYPRRAFLKEVGVLLNGSYTIVEGQELGEGGIAFLWPKNLPEDQSLLLTFKIDSCPIFVVRGQVRFNLESRNSGAFRVGVEFDDAGFSVKRQIRTFIATKVSSDTQAQERRAAA